MELAADRSTETDECCPLRIIEGTSTPLWTDDSENSVAGNATNEQ